MKENVAHLQRRLAMWVDGNITALVQEGRSLQHQKKYHRGAPRQGKVDKARQFGILMSEGRVQEALRSLSSEINSSSSDVLGMDETITINRNISSVRDVLESKHPPGLPADQNTLLKGDVPTNHSVRFDPLTEAVAKTAAMRG